LGVALPPPEQPRLGDYLLLGLIAERPTHGFALSRQVARNGPIGRVYEISRPNVYQAICRLTATGLVVPVGTERTSVGPQRTLVRATLAGRHLAQTWLDQPARHVRDLDTELLLKLFLLERAGRDATPLLQAQRRVLQPIGASLSAQRQWARDFDQTIVAWRHAAALAAMHFLDYLEASQSIRRSLGTGKPRSTAFDDSDRLEAVMRK
jgi:DNA-binding PadR family transcriptional regulator